MHLISTFIDHLAFEKRYSEHTCIAYKKDLHQFFDEFSTVQESNLEEITTKHVRNYVVQLVDFGLENTSINRKISALKSFFKFAKTQGLITKNPTTLVKNLKTKKRLPQFVPEKQLWDSAIFNQEKTPEEQLEVELYFELFYQTGIRLSELIQLKRTDVHTNQIKVLGKRNKERLIPITASLYQLIKKQIDNLNPSQTKNGLLFSSKNGKKRSPKFVYNKVNYYLGLTTNLGKKSPHILRHSFATHMLNNGASIESIKALLGHTDLTATQIYTHNSFKELKSIYNQSHPRGT